MNNENPFATGPREKRCLLIACEIMFREACYVLSQTPSVVDVVFLQKGLHDMGEAKMQAVIQAELDKAGPDKYEAVLLGYGLCNNGIRGLRAGVPVVVPRAHDCITLFMGSRKRYKDYFDQNPGTYYKTSGWIERENTMIPQGSVLDQLGLGGSYADYAEKYGEENAEYLMEMLGGGLNNYTKMTFINMSFVSADGACVAFGDTEAYRESAKRDAAERGWQFEEIAGDMRLIKKLLCHEWDAEEFLVVPPGRAIAPANTDEIVTFE